MAKRRNNRQKRRNIGNVSAQQFVNGSLRVKGEEQIIDLTASTPVVTAKLCPGQSSMSMLDNYAKIFDRYRFEEIKITYYPSVGTTTGGTVVAGIDFDPRHEPSAFGHVMACVPKMVGAVWQTRSLSVPKRQLMSRKLLYTYRAEEKERPAEDSSAMILAVAHNGDTKATGSFGFYVVSYVAYFEGPFSGN